MYLGIKREIDRVPNRIKLTASTIHTHLCAHRPEFLVYLKFWQPDSTSSWMQRICYTVSGLWQPSEGTMRKPNTADRTVARSPDLAHSAPSRDFHS